MKIRTSRFETGAVRPGQWPMDGLPEFAFIGRSNVGKSSLLNRLLNRKSLARVSGTPGKTREINFFVINEAFRFVDLPGYGYAHVSKQARQRLGQIIETYFQERTPLLRVFHLVDSRHPPSGMDVEVYQWFMELSIPVAVVATKIDKISRSAVHVNTGVIRRDMQLQSPFLPVSAEKQIGLDMLWGQIEKDLTAAAAEPHSAPADEGEISDGC